MTETTPDLDPLERVIYNELIALAPSETGADCPLCGLSVTELEALDPDYVANTAGHVAAAVWAALGTKVPEGEPSETDWSRPRSTPAVGIYIDETENAVLRRALAGHYERLGELSRIRNLSPETDAAIEADMREVLAIWRRISQMPNGVVGAPPVPNPALFSINVQAER